MLKLIRRDPSYVKGYRDYCREFYNHHIVSFKPTDPEYIDENWFERTAEWYKKQEQGSLPGQVRSFHYWAVDDGKFIGEFQLRPDRNDDLMTGIGNIGCSVRVTEWGKGYGKEILKQGIEIAKKFGLKKVLLIINDDNAASVHVCEANGGVLMDKITAESKDEGKRLVRRYWIAL